MLLIKHIFILLLSLSVKDIRLDLVVFQIDEVLKTEGRAQVMTSHMDQLLMMLSMQFKLVYSTFMGDPLTNRDDIIKLYKCLLGTLLAVSCNLATQVTGEVTRYL